MSGGLLIAIVGVIWLAASGKTGSGTGGALFVVLLFLCPIFLPFIILDVLSRGEGGGNNGNFVKVVLDD